MKADTSILIVKGSALFVASICLTLASSLAQWANSGESPSAIVWVIIIATCIGTGATQIVSFLSESYSQWKAKAIDTVALVKNQPTESNENKTTGSDTSRRSAPDTLPGPN